MLAATERASAVAGLHSLSVLKAELKQASRSCLSHALPLGHAVRSCVSAVWHRETAVWHRVTATLN